MLEAGAKLNVKVGQSFTIHHAISHFQPEILDLILQFGADVNRHDDGGRTALHILIGKWNIDDGRQEERRRCLKLLLDHPAVDVEAKDGDGKTPHDIASAKRITYLTDEVIL